MAYSEFEPSEDDGGPVDKTSYGSNDFILQRPVLLQWNLPKLLRHFITEDVGGRELDVDGLREIEKGPDEVPGLPRTLTALQPLVSLHVELLRVLIKLMDGLDHVLGCELHSCRPHTGQGSTGGLWYFSTSRFEF